MKQLVRNKIYDMKEPGWNTIYNVKKPGWDKIYRVKQPGWKSFHVIHMNHGRVLLSQSSHVMEIVPSQQNDSIDFQLKI